MLSPRPFIAYASLLSMLLFWSGALQPSNFVGSWALTVPGGHAGWLGVSEREGKLSAEIMWIGGSVLPVDEARLEGDTLLLTRRHRIVERDANGSRTERTAVETIKARRRGDALEMSTVTVDPKVTVSQKEQSFTAKLLPPMPPAPDLGKVKFGPPIELFNGKNLDGWRLTDPGAANGWKVEHGELINDPAQKEGEPHKNYGNLRTDREFEDFRITLDVNVPRRGNSGVYLRGVYEVQVADSHGRPIGGGTMGAVYSRIKPSASAEKPAGEWQTLVITLVDRHITVVLNGTKIVNNQPVLGPTGGALWSDVTKPGPIYLQGDHAAVRYRNITLRPALR